MYQKNELMNSSEMETRMPEVTQKLKEMLPITFIIKLIILFLREKLKGFSLNHFLLSEVWSVTDYIFEKLS